ncbi:hypothetical protein HJD18_08085 [Thermoleophilia bacterium SCSIO 60948]|nr:hypothetical protein HJD18_08085 [Thermoleophilia bacterium SCSIO 60948]
MGASARARRAVARAVATIGLGTACLAFTGIPADGATRTYLGESSGSGIELKVREKRSRLTVTSVAVAAQVRCASGLTGTTAQRHRIGERVGRRGRFEATSYRPLGGSRSVLNVKGDLEGRRITGVFSFTFDSQNDGSCSSAITDFDARRQD